MLHSLLVAVALLSSPTQWCGGGGGCCVRPIGGPTPFVPLPAMSIAPPRVDMAKVIRVDEYPQALRIGMAIIAPRPISNAMIAILQAEAQTAPK